MAFLSLLDDRARPKGSRDPLGFELIWTHFGRKVVGNLTTITSSWRTFSVGLLGFYWCNQLCRDTHPQEKQVVLQQHFIRYEQLAAYLRSSANDHELLGITRVRTRLGEQHESICIGTDAQDLILSDQISYGIWGLYSTALRESGLVRGDFRELTQQGLDIASQIDAGLEKAWYWAFIRGEKKAVAVADLAEHGKRFVKAIAGKKVKDTLIERLLRGPADHRRQLALYETVQKIPSEILRQDGLSTAQFIAAVRDKSSSPELTQSLDDILRVERLLVTANILFDYCRRKDGEKLEIVANAVKDAYDFNFLPEGPSSNGCPYGQEMGILRTQLRAGQVLLALRSLLELNKTIMDSRGGAAWVEEQTPGTLRVRMKAEAAHLPPLEQLQSDWHYDYFLRSYARIAAREKE
jgi:hypothetical protein